MHQHSTSVDQATTSIETLTSLVEIFMQNNKDLCSRVANLESSPKYVDEDDVSTIRSKQKARHPTMEIGESAMTAIKQFTFEQDLGESKVYSRARRRKSLESLQSAGPSFGWSCLSELSLAQVSNISVISLPLTANELANAKHYSWTSTTEQIMRHTRPHMMDVTAAEPGNHALGHPLDPELPSVKEVVILG